MRDGRFAGLALLLVLSVHSAFTLDSTVRFHSAQAQFSHALSTLQHASTGAPRESHALKAALDDAIDVLLFTDPQDLAHPPHDAGASNMRARGGVDLDPHPQDASNMRARGDLLLQDAGVRDWFTGKYELARTLRTLPGALADAEGEAEIAEGNEDASPSQRTLDVVGALLFGLINGLTMGMGDMYRGAIDDFKRDAQCESLAEPVSRAFRTVRSVPVRLLRGVYGPASARSGAGRVDFVARELKSGLVNLGDFFTGVVSLVRGCGPLRTMLLPLAVLVVLGITVTLALFLLPGFGVVLKVAGMLLSVVFGAKFLVEVAGKLSGAVARCVAKRGCDRHGFVGLVESLAELVGLTVSLVFLSGIREALRTPDLASHFSRAALMLRLRLTFTPRWSKDLARLAQALEAAKAGSAASRGSVAALSDDAAGLSDDASKIARGSADDVARGADDVPGVPRSTGDAIAKGAEDGAKIVDDASDAAKAAFKDRAAGEAQVATARIDAAKAELAQAEKALSRAQGKSRDWRPGPAKEYKRMVHEGNGRFREVNYGPVSQSNPHAKDVAAWRRKVKSAGDRVARAEDEAAKLSRNHADEFARISAEASKLRGATSKLASKTDDLAKATDDLTTIKARCCNPATMVLLETGAGQSVGVCVMELGASKMQLDRALKKLETVKRNVEKGVIDKEAVAFDLLEYSLKFHPGVRLGDAVSKATEAKTVGQALSPLIRNALKMDKPGKPSVLDAINFIKQGGLDGWKARRLAGDLDEAIKGVQRAERYLDHAKAQYLRAEAAAEAAASVAK